MMTTHTVQETPDIETGQEDPKYLTDSQHRKVLIRRHQQDIETYEEMKQEDKEQGCSKRKLMWYKNQIDQLREKIRDLEQGDQQ